MARSNTAPAPRRLDGPKIALCVSTAIASLALSGCTAAAPPAQTSLSKAQTALDRGQPDRAIAHAEAAVLAAPRDAAYRAVLGAAYMKAGRFESAATSFGEALELGDTQPRTVLSFALAKIGSGDNQSALNALSHYEGAIPVADYGLALALAGEPERGVHQLINSVRQGANDAKTRQNLAYSYALAGNWRAARVMAAEDVPADQLDARLSDWAATARPEDSALRVANLLGVALVADGGMPQHLALANFPTTQMMVAEVEEARSDEMNADVAAAPSESEALAFGSPKESVPANGPTVETVDPSNARPTRVAAVAASASRAPATATPVRAAANAGPRFVSNPVVQVVPDASAEARVQSRAPRRVASAQQPQPARQQARSTAASGAAATHLVQLGSFDSRAVAEGKWREFTRRFPSLSAHDVVITEAEVNGRRFFRVAAEGFGRRGALNLCRQVKAAGRGCFTYAAANPPAGAIDRGVRVASR